MKARRIKRYMPLLFRYKIPQNYVYFVGVVLTL